MITWKPTFLQVSDRGQEIFVRKGVDERLPMKSQKAVPTKTFIDHAQM